MTTHLVRARRPLASLSLLALLCAALALPSRAHAGEAGAPAAAPTELRWYGWQIMAADAAAGAVTWAGSHAGVAAAPGAAIYLAGGPTVHLLHHQPGGALRSGLLRVLLPTAGALLAYRLETSSSGEDKGFAALGGAALGCGAAALVDWATAFERVPAAGAPQAQAPAAQPGDWSAGVAPTRGGARLAVAVAF